MCCLSLQTRRALVQLSQQEWFQMTCCWAPLSFPLALRLYCIQKRADSSARQGGRDLFSRRYRKTPDGQPVHPFVHLFRDRYYCSRDEDNKTTCLEQVRVGFKFWWCWSETCVLPGWLPLKLVGECEDVRRYLKTALTCNERRLSSAKGTKGGRC